jgi:hypothetical protein
MKKRLTIALLCAVTLVAVFGVSGAEARGLSFRTAKTLAKRLAAKQVRGRNVVSFHLTVPRRVSPTRILFAYDDRTADNVFCTAALIIDQTVKGRFTTITARFTGQRCNGVPFEVLKFEAITRNAQRELRTNTAATVGALDAVKRAATRCRNVRVPKRAVSGAQALFDIAQIRALEGTNDAAVGRFTTTLLLADATNPILHAGAVGWADYVATVRALPNVGDPCTALKQWSTNSFAPDAAPIDFAAYRRLDRRAGVDRTAIVRAAGYMSSKGAFPNAVLGFTPNGLLLQLAARVGVSGGSRGKLLLGS